ncbi:retrovirus-related pol polyprotein from transposon TNT 1-94 [Tanacetum coccineum]
MSTYNTHQQSLADAGSETRPPMLERGSYIPWEIRFRRYLNRKRENKKWLNKANNEGPYEFKEFTRSESEPPRMQKEEDLKGDDLKHYKAEIEAMNLILISIPNDIYNSMDACTTTQAMWQRGEHLMRGTVQNKVDRETRFNNKFDQFIAEPGEALVSVYNHFDRLMNDLERNGIIIPKVTVNTKFLNCLQPQWLKYVTQVRLAKRLTTNTYDDLFDYLQQFKKLVNASIAKKLEKSHDPLALVAHTGSSSRTTSPYYVTHPYSVVGYDDDYQWDAVQNTSKDPLTSTMILLARAITQRFSNLQIIIFVLLLTPEIKPLFKPTKYTFKAGNLRTLQTTSSGTAANVQCYNCNEKGHYAHNFPKPRVRDLKYFMEQMLLAKPYEAGVILTDEHNDFIFADASQMEEIEELSANIYTQEQKYLKQPKIINNTINDDQIDNNIIFDEPNGDVNSGSVEYDNNLQESYELEKLARNTYKEAEKQQIIAKKVQQQNSVLTKQLESYKEKNPKLYEASCLDDSKIHVNVRDTEEILDDATKSQIKMKKKSQDSIAIEKKQNV